MYAARPSTPAYRSDWILCINNMAMIDSMLPKIGAPVTVILPISLHAGRKIPAEKRSFVNEEKK